MRHRDLYIRPMEKDDLTNVAALLDKSLEHDPVDVDWVREKTFLDQDYNRDLALCGIHNGELVGFTQGIIRTPADHGHVKWFATREDYRGKGVATALFDKIEDGLKRRGAERIGIANAVPGQVDSGLDPRYTAAFVFLQGRGYEHTATVFNMDCDLALSDWNTGEEERMLTERHGLEARRARREDMQAVLDLLRQHFSGWIPEVSQCFVRDPITLHVVADGDRIVGFAAYDTTNVGRGWFGPMGTDPDYRRKGIGRITLLRCLADQKRQGHRVSTIPWVGPYGFYWKHCRAVVSRAFWQMWKQVSQAEQG